ncbi:hypothetical protein PUN28_014790 [Cardiocondyla obscurior]|uniref:Ashwin n=1 Tax=Cardiocondyla obscurior TaxID=286306 RepID=A0AAW2F1G2_9HYME
MSRPKTYELTHPEFLSEYQLREILKNSCIESLKFEKLCRSELLEIYRRVAMPLPQRQHGAVKSSNTTYTLEKSVTTGNDDNVNSLALGSGKGNKRMFSQVDKSKPSLNDQKVEKKTRLCSTSKAETGWNGIRKCTYEEQNEEITKKRQKITWP